MRLKAIEYIFIAATVAILFVFAVNIGYVKAQDVCVTPDRVLIDMQDAYGDSVVVFNEITAGAADEFAKTTGWDGEPVSRVMLLAAVQPDGSMSEIGLVVLFSLNNCAIANRGFTLLDASEYMNQLKAKNEA